MKRFWVVVLVIVVVAGLAALAWGLWSRRTQAQAGPPADSEVYTVSRGDVAEVVEATGNLSPVSQASLAFSTQGTLVEIRVNTGDRVSQGQVLARLDSGDLELQLAQAQTGLDAAHANLEKLLAGAQAEDLTVAQSNLEQALASLEEQRVTLAASTEQARLSWTQSANNLRDAQANYSRIYWDNREMEDRLAKIKKNLPQESIDAEAQAWRAVENGEAAMEQARLSYEQALERQQASLRTAQAQVDSARANLAKLTNGASAEDVAAAQASVAQSQASYDLARSQLGKATLTAPFAGVAATVLAEVNNQVSSATPILVLLDPTSYYVDVEVDEVDITRVAVGQDARVLFDALPEVELQARVEEVALSPSTGQGVVTYRVRVRIAELGNTEVRSGMTTNVGIVTREARGVLLVPRRAVRIEDGQAYVELVREGDRGKWLERVPVTLGLGDSFNVEIVSGLQEGDQVFVLSVVQKNQLQQMFGAGQSPGGVRQQVAPHP